jgi:dihydrolipoamide dehydrogenase
MVKIVSEKKSGRLPGVHIIGPHATDMIGAAVLGMSLDMTVSDLAAAIHPRPTFSEALMEAAKSMSRGAIHFL